MQTSSEDLLSLWWEPFRPWTQEHSVGLKFQLHQTGASGAQNCRSQGTGLVMECVCSEALGVHLLLLLFLILLVLPLFF